MPTRAAAAREAALLKGVSSITPKRTAARRSLKTANEIPSSSINGGVGNTTAASIAAKSALKNESLEPTLNAKKRKRTQAKDNQVINGVPIKGGFEELPHNMGGGGTDVSPNNDPVTKELQQEKIKIEGDLSEETKPNRKRARRAPAPNKAENIKVKVEEISDTKEEPKQRRALRKVDTSKDVMEKVESLVESVDVPVAKAEKAKRKKKNPYGLTPGESPFPDFEMPTTEAAFEVSKLLSELHGVVEVPKEIPAPSLEVTGCGEVPSVLDALIRTLLSASTTGQNAKYAFQGLVERYGIYEDGIGKGSVNWNKVREASLDDCEKAIRRGGLSKMKSKNIKAILELVHEQNVARRKAFEMEKETGISAGVVGWDTKTQGQKDLEIATADANILSLQYMHGLDSDSAMLEFLKFPGIGVKTSSCVILFCLQRPSFAVDTHVFRLCKWLKWVPDNATRDQTFSHCEVRIPNDLKYGLHQLFIRHGKTCGRCRAATGETSEAWETAECPIEHLVERTGARKRGSTQKGTGAKKTPKKSKANKKASKWDGDSEAEDEESDELSDGQGRDDEEDF